MNGVLRNTWYWLAGSALLAILILTLIFLGSWYIQLITAIAIVGGGIIFHMIGIRWSFHAMMLTFPLSITLPVSGESLVMFPSELLVMALAVSVILHWLRFGSEFMLWLKHPVTIALAGYLFFLLISGIYSEMLMVSVKSIIIKLLYVISFYGGACIYFSNTRNTNDFFKFYLFPFLVIILITLAKHSEYSFSKDVSGYVTKPFYQDHTIYSAAMAFLLPLVGFQVKKSSGYTRLLYLAIFILFTVAIFFAGSRAAWLSLGITLCFGLLLVFRIPPSGYLIMVLLSALLVLIKSDEILWMLKSNRFDSNARNADIGEQTRSVINITNDQSNAERINRWKCAWRMFEEKPLAGFGPGTYQFTYFPFQREKEMTRISVTTPYNIEEGKGGTAHNEFLLVLAESGVAAAIFFTAMVLLVFGYGIINIHQGNNGLFSLAMLLAFTTYVTHSLFNNFLDTDKTAVFFFTAMAYFVSKSGTKSQATGI